MATIQRINVISDLLNGGSSRGFCVSEQIVNKDTKKRPQLSIKTSSLIFYIDDPQEFFFLFCQN